MESEKITFSIAKKSVIGDRIYQQDKAKFKKTGNRAAAVLCDGMGGKEGGAAASQMAAHYFIKDMVDMPYDEHLPDKLCQEMDRLDEKVLRIKDKTGRLLSAGTTLAAVLIEGNRLWHVSVGDSRIYLLREGELTCLTVDHNYELVLREYRAKGYISQEELAESLQDSRAQSLISYLGLGKKKIIDKNEAPLEMKEGDKIILCSDGLYKSLYESQIRAIVSEEYGKIDEIADRLVQVAENCSANDQDNTTVMVIDFYKER